MEVLNLKYDGPLDIATGRSRKETHWRNKEIIYSDFVSKVSSTHRTAETLSEYTGSKKTRQDEIKDNGGYVFGYVNNGRRKAENITHRQALTLDIDFGKGQTWPDYKRKYDNAAAIYSTHKHTPENPRLRLILPIDRPVSTDEYVAIARRIAGDLDINTFDDTTFEPSRLMYWPSTSKDGEYISDYQDGPWLCADTVLATYNNWKDASEWPVSDRAGEVLQREIKKQGDPLEKPGVVGAFCRTYDIHEAIETFLPDDYEACDIEDRYTYKSGSTAAGLVVYDDKYAYSHHGTDPASGKLCNAFDLVRLHLYGLKDEDAKEGTPSNKLPSFLAMTDLSANDSKVRKRLGTERRQEIKDDFSGASDPEESDEENHDWEEKLEIDRKGNCKGRITDFEILFQNHPAFKGLLKKNTFSNTFDICGNLPWGNTKNEWTDSDDNQLISWSEKYGMPVNTTRINIARDNVFNNNCYHPVRDYLLSCVWDGEQRIETLFVDYLGAENSLYIRTISRMILVAAVARIFRPGVKFDHVLVIIGKQGQGKSTFIKKLGGPWYSDSFMGVQGKEAFEQIQGVWIFEIAELAGFKKSDTETIKLFISKTDDRYRVSYGRRVESFPRQCVFFATTNNRDFLRDPTGDRRFWPVEMNETKPKKSIFKDLDQYEIDQVWAEAVKLFNAGESIHLSQELEQMARAKQTEHTFMDDRTEPIIKYLETLLPTNWATMDYWERKRFLDGDELQPKGTIQRQKVSVAEIWCECFGKDVADMTKYNTGSLHDIMRSLEGWEEGNNSERVKNYKQQRCYTRKNSDSKNVSDKKKNLLTINTN